MNKLFQKKIYIYTSGEWGVGVAEDMKFINKMQKLKGPRKGIFRGDQEKIMWNFHEPWIQALEFPRGIYNTSFGNSRGEASFCPELLGVK